MLDEFHEPAHDVVELPPYLAWSGMTAYDLDNPRQRMGLYRTVLHEGLHDDLPYYVNRDLLLGLWPVLRTPQGPDSPGLEGTGAGDCPRCPLASP